MWKLRLKLIGLNALNGMLTIARRLLIVARGGLVVMGAVLTMIGVCVVCVAELIALPVLMVLAAKRFMREWRTDEKKDKGGIKRWEEDRN